jgi:hypothetical protein
MQKRYWLVHPHGGWQLIDPREFDLNHLAEQARKMGGRLVAEGDERLAPVVTDDARPPRVQPEARFDLPVVALGHIFRERLRKIHDCKRAFALEMNCRPTDRVLGGYYKSRSLVRVYTHDRKTGRRPNDELFDTFLHEVAHHIEYTEPESFRGQACGRVHGRMHSRLFWRILGELKQRWEVLQRKQQQERAHQGRSVNGD